MRHELHGPLTDRKWARASAYGASPTSPVVESAESKRTTISVMLSLAAPSLARASKFLAATSGAGSAPRMAAIASFVTISVNPSEHRSKRSPPCTSSARASTLNAELRATNDVRDRVTEPVLGDLIRPKGSAAPHPPKCA